MLFGSKTVYVEKGENTLASATGDIFSCFAMDDFSLSCMDRVELAKQLEGFKKQEALLSTGKEHSSARVVRKYVCARIY